MTPTKLASMFMALALFLTLAASPCAAKKPQTVVVMETSKGIIFIMLDHENAPATVSNFLRYVDSGHYDGTIFHRVIDGFMIQGGNFVYNMTRKATDPPIPNEAHNGLRNQRGTIAMARTSDVDSATDQFFINLVDNDFLNHRDKTRSGYGYCVFGKVIRGMETVDAIAKAKTGRQMGMKDVPLEPVTIMKVYRHPGQ